MREMDKTYSNGEMVDMLLENIKREAFVESGIYSKEIPIIINRNGELAWKNSYLPLSFNLINKNTRWTIIEPPKKLKEMSFGEAVYRWSHNSVLMPLISRKDIISCVSGKDIDRSFIDIDKDEYLGFWTIKGVYEDD